MGELIDLTAYRAAKAGPELSEVERALREKVPARYRSVLEDENWLAELAAKVGLDVAFKISPDELVAVAVLVAGRFNHRGC